MSHGMQPKLTRWSARASGTCLAATEITFQLRTGMRCDGNERTNDPFEPAEPYAARLPRAEKSEGSEKSERKLTASSLFSVVSEWPRGCDRYVQKVVPADAQN